MAISARPAGAGGGGWLSPEMILRIASFGGLLFALVLIVQQRSYTLAVFFAIALGLLLYIEFGQGAKLLSKMINDDLRNQKEL